LKLPSVSNWHFAAAAPTLLARAPVSADPQTSPEKASKTAQSTRFQTLFSLGSFGLSISLRRLDAHTHGRKSRSRVLWSYPPFFTSVWLWLFTGAAFLLKFGSRFAIGFQWFNSNAGMEHKPFGTIGLVAIELIALLLLMAIPGNSFTTTRLAARSAPRGTHIASHPPRPIALPSSGFPATSR
jgi:hypothetical protein